MTKTREQYDKLQGTISKFCFHAAFKYLHSLMVRDLLVDACNSLKLLAIIILAGILPHYQVILNSATKEQNITAIIDIRLCNTLLLYAIIDYPFGIFDHFLYNMQCAC